MVFVIGVAAQMIGVALLMGAIWFQYCNFRTHEERLKMIYDAVATPPWAYQSRMAAFATVSYDQHLWRLATFRDPKKLYPAFHMMTSPEGDALIVNDGPHTVQ